MKKKLMLSSIYLGLLIAYSCALFGCNEKKPVYIPNVVTWYETELQINYQNGVVEIDTIDVYENLDNIKVENGNLSYLKPTKETGGVITYNVKLASFVRSFKILNSKLITKTEKI